MDAATATRRPVPSGDDVGDRSRAPRGRFAGAATLARLALRRDRVRLPLWLLGVVGFVVGSAASFERVFPTAAERQPRAELMASPMMRAFNGPGFGLDDYTIGAMVANELLVLAAVAVAVMSLLTVVRHTRAEEQAGRAELLRAQPVGLHAAPAAALLVAVGANLAIGAALAAGLQAGVADLAAAGAWAFGLSTAAVGVAFAAVAACTAQVTEHARGASGYAVVALGVAFALRAVGDAGGVDDRALSWLSPIGWAQSTRAFVDERWWPLLLCLAFAGVLAAAAFALADRRDVGAGLVRPRPGPARAARLLAQPLGLALRLHRGAILAWSAGLAVFGFSFGAVIGDIEAFLDDNPQLEEIFGRATGAGLLDSFLATVVLILALLATGAALAVVLRVRGEEVDGRAEPLLATPLSRLRWAGSHVGVALAGSAATVAAGTLGLGVAAAVDQRDAALVPELLGAGLVYLPAVWLTAGVVVALVGLAPRATALAWVVVVHAVVVGLLGDVLDLPEPLRALSPHHHVPALPAAELTWAPLLGLAAGAAALIAAGLVGLRRRDLPRT